MTERDFFFSTGNHTKRPYFVVKKNAYYTNAFGTIFSSFVRGLSTKLLTCFNGQTSSLERSRSKVHLHMQCLHLKPSEHLKPFFYRDREFSALHSNFLDELFYTAVSFRLTTRLSFHLEI